MKADWTAQLAPERAPPPPSWWPPAPGWWLLAALILLLLGAAIAWWKFSPAGRRRRLRRTALAQLTRIRSLEGERQARGLQHLMRRYAVSVYGPTVAPLSGERWLRFVAARGAVGLAGITGQRFLEAAYGRSGPADAEWLRAAEAFIRHAPRAGEAR